MKPRYLPLLLLLSLLPTTHAAADTATIKAKMVLEQTYARHGGQEQAREQLMPTAESKMRLCATCHKADGNSTKPGFPTLAGQRPDYLLKRWYELKAGHGESKTARTMVRRINEEQMIALALYFAGEIRYSPLYDDKLAGNGAEVYVSTCQECHGADGRGEPGTPIIAAQQPGYMHRTLLRFRDQSGWRHGSTMVGIPDQLSPIQIKATAHYAASLAPVAP